jgi:hypothetical protein
LARDPPRGALELGSDPIVLHVDERTGSVWLAEQRGRSGRPELVRLDPAAGPDRNLVEGTRVTALEGSLSERATLTGLAVRGPTLFVAARAATKLTAFDAATLTRRRERDVPLGERADVVALASEGDCLYALDHGSELAASEESATSSPLREAHWPARQEQAPARLRSFCDDGERAAPIAPRSHALAVDGPRVVVASALDHTIELFDLTTHDALRAAHDGPIFAVDVAGDWVVAGGLEDHPLDRGEGFFGHIDSTLFLYEREEGALRRRAELNLSELGVLTPKLVRFVAADRVLVLGYGSGRAAEIRVSSAGLELRSVFDSVPGIVDGALDGPFDGGGRFLGVSELLDRIVSTGPGTPPTLVGHRAGDSPSDQRLLRLGEALLFTELMAPSQHSEGAHSRFTCEACHFRGGVDGRRHHTGRGDVHATTKPLFGLAQNTPLFTRALDPDVATMVFAEFEVASRGTGHPGWVDLGEVALPWVALAELGEDLSPIAQRDALARYLRERPFEPNLDAQREGAWTAEVERGAGLFARWCESCHAARLVASDPSTRVPPADWRALVTSPEGPIVRGRDGYERTGIEPYVHELGARPSSLRRIAWKTPYFTDGSSQTLEDVLTRVGRPAAGALPTHHGGPPLLDREEVLALQAFLRLL